MPTALSVCPSTTAAALSSLLTQTPPGQHNMLSYQLYDPQREEKFNLISFEGYSGSVAEFQDQSTCFERLAQAGHHSYALGPKKFIGRGLSLAILRGAEYVSSQNLDARARDAARLAATPSFVYFYIAEVDHSGHGHGVGSEQWVQSLEETDRAVGILLDNLPPLTQVIITADHGMINASASQILDLASSPVAAEIRELSGEGRALHLRVNPVQVPRVCEALKELLPQALIMTREECARLFEKYNRVAVRRPELLGDVVIFASGSWQVLDSRFHQTQVFKMCGIHGGLSEAEMRIPLLSYHS